MAAKPIPKVTAAEYLTKERETEFKSEFVGGKVFRCLLAAFAKNEKDDLTPVELKLLRKFAESLRGTQ